MCMVVCRPAAVIPANAGIQQHNAAGLYRKKPKPHRLSFPQKLESKNATQQEFIGKNRTPPTAVIPAKAGIQ
ncbi:phage associated protein, partial [Neisseria meningitidis]